MQDVLNLKMEEIVDVVFTPTHRQKNNKLVDKDNHYLVDDYGKTILITDDHKEAMICYSELTDSRQKALIHVQHGIQKPEITNAPLMYGLTECLCGFRHDS